jgi:pyruvate/2-oxoglutarate dehydrogenase complex dihydrolipoamide acyltransferase (E2) component
MAIEFVVVRLAQLHPRMDRNTIVTWLVGEGAYVRPREPFYVVETRKSTFEVCSEWEGTVERLLVPQGGKVGERQEIALIRPAGGAPDRV